MRGTMHHIDLTVTDLGISAPFYERVLGFMGYAKSKTDADGIDLDLQTAGGMCSVGVRCAHRKREHDRYTPGLHHFAWRADSRADVEALYRLLQDMGASILDAPADYPQYGAGYFAVFFADPDGLKLEYVHVPSG